MKHFFLLSLVFLFQLGFSQITSTAVNKSNFETSGFPFKGVRVLTVENISTPKEENYFVFSKNEKGSEQDELYIQQFKKINGNWELTTEKTVAEKGIITSVWDARKAFFDADKDGQADVLFIYSKHPSDNLNSQLDVVLVLIYKNNIYTLGNAGENNYDPMYDYVDAGFEGLPQAVQDYVWEYWEKLDKK